MNILSGILQAIFGAFFQFGTAFVSDNFIEGQTPAEEAIEADSFVDDEGEDLSE